MPPRRRRSKHKRVITRTLAELDRHFWNEGFNREGYRIAVEAHIFGADGRVLRQTRGPASRDEVGHLEGIGGEVGAQDADLIAALHRHVREEIGDVDIAVDYLLEVRPVRFVENDGQARDWFVLSYLCRLMRGTPTATDTARVAERRFGPVGWRCTPSADHAEATPPAAPVPMSWATATHKTGRGRF